MPRAIFFPVASALLLCASGCHEPSEGAASPDDAAAAAEPQSDRENADPVRLCDAIQRSSEIPIGCTFAMVEGQPHMLLRVPNRETLDENARDMVTHLAAPFCKAQNDAGQAAGVIFMVGNRFGRHLTCQTGTLGDWVDASPREAETLTIGQACDAVSRGNYGVRCALMDLDGMPAMVLSYQRNQEAAGNLVGIARDVGGPFCASANESNVRATMVFLDDGLTARAFNCATGQLSAPFQVAKQPPTKRSPKPARTPSQGPDKEPPADAGERWTLRTVSTSARREQ